MRRLLHKLQDAGFGYLALGVLFVIFGLAMSERRHNAGR